MELQGSYPDTTTIIAHTGIIPGVIQRLRCCACGHTGIDVAMVSTYIGGQGYVNRPECINLPQCWERLGWNKEIKQ